MRSGSRGLCREGKSQRISRPVAKTFKFKCMTFYSVLFRKVLHIFEFLFGAAETVGGGGGGGDGTGR